MEKYDVIIIGAGPSGLSCALSIYNNNIKNILVVEKYKFPRDKCCAGYITNKTKKAFEKYGLDINKCNYSLIKDFNILYKNKKYQTITNKFLYTNKMINRVELDYNFYKLAKEKGIKIIEGTTITNNDIGSHTLTINKNKKIEYKKLVFADGTSGFSSKYQKNKKRNIAMQLVIEQKEIEKIDIHFGITKKGYGWVSSNNDALNIGLTDVYEPNINYQEIFKNYLNKLNIDIDTKNLKGAFTPIGIGTSIIKNDIYLIGDAVGACDPLTLSGLRYGLETGKICALSIVKNNNKIYSKYIFKLKIKFIIMQFISKIFYLKISSLFIFKVGCKYFNKLIAIVFNNFFVNKK